MRQVYVNKTVSRNFFIDIISNFQNMFGLNLTGYEKMTTKAMAQIRHDLEGVELEWFRYEITQLTNGALSVTLYGEEKMEKKKK